MAFQRIELLLPLLKSSVISIIVTSFPLFQHEFSLNLTQLGLIATCYYLFAFIGSIAWTFLNGRISRLHIFCIGGFIWTSFTILLSFANSYLILIVMIGVIGFGSESTTVIIWNEMIELSTDINRGKNQSYYLVVNGIGTIIGWIATGIIEGSYGYSWNVPLEIVGLFSLSLVCVLILILHKNVNRYTQSSPGTFSIYLQKMQLKPDWKLIKETLSNKINVLLVLLCLIFLPINSNLSTWLQQFFIQSRQFSQSMASIAIVFVFSAAFLAQIVGGFIIDRYFHHSSRSKIGLGIAVTFISAPLFLPVFIIPWEMPVLGQNLNYFELAIQMGIEALGDPNVFWSFICLFIGFFISSFLSIIVPLVLASSNSPRTRTLAFNLFIIVFNSAWILGPVLGGATGDSIGLNVVFLLEPMVLIIIGLIFIAIYRIAGNNEGLQVRTEK